MQCLIWNSILITVVSQTETADSGNQLCIGVAVVLGFIVFLVMATDSPSPTDRARKMISSVAIQDAKDKAKAWNCLSSTLKDIEQKIGIAKSKLTELTKATAKDKKETLVTEIENLTNDALKNYELLSRNFQSCQSLTEQLHNLEVELRKVNWGKSEIFANALFKDTEAEVKRATQLPDYLEVVTILKDARRDLKNHAIRLANKDVTMSKQVNNIVNGSVGVLNTGDNADVSGNNVYFQNIDSAKLADELSRLRMELKKRATTPEHDTDIGLVASAQLEAKKGNKDKAAAYLSKVSAFVLDVAAEITAGIVLGILKVH